MTLQGRRAVFEKTGGHCHFCGDQLEFSHYGETCGDNLEGAWELDHVVQRRKGGASNSDNYLPACWNCNRLRWHRKGRDLRRLILLGLVANDEIKAGTGLGREIRSKFEQRTAKNRRRQRAAGGDY